MKICKTSIIGCLALLVGGTFVPESSAMAFKGNMAEILIVGGIPFAKGSTLEYQANHFLFAQLAPGSALDSLPTDRATELVPGSQEPEANFSPTLAFGLSGVNDWATAMQFIDLMKMARPWIGHEPGQWGGTTVDELRAGGFLDEKGWLTSIPEGVEKVGTIWAWGNQSDAAPDRMGTYTLTYEGEGTVALGLDAHVLSSEPGKRVFENRNGNSFVLNILETDPEETGDYIRDISIVHEQYLDLHEAGGLFNPDWLELIENARQVRFMDWQETNNSSTISWDERTQSDGLRTDDGVAVEDMVHLANLAGSDPWFNMPHLADDAYIRSFATYVRDNLDPALTVRVEYSNEWWNWSFQQTQWLKAQAQAEWGVDDFGAVLSYGAKMATNMAVIWSEVFAEEPERRLVTVLGSQAVNPWVSDQVMNAPQWLINEPNAYIQPASVFDELAITSYFGDSVISNETNRDALLAAIDDPAIDAGAMVHDWLQDPTFKSSIPFNAAIWAEQQAMAHEEGLRLTSYEGGQHLHHTAFIAGITPEQESQLTEFMIDFVRSDYMAELYAGAWSAWAAVSDGPFMQFTDVEYPSKWGSFGAYSHLGDETPRSQILETLNATTTPWWE